jgi:hypothetical protein
MNSTAMERVSHMRMEASPNLANILRDDINWPMHQFCNLSLPIRCPSVATQGIDILFCVVAYYLYSSSRLSFSV